jgi:hypothetical protein
MLELTAVELIKNLDKTFPHRCPRIGDTERRIWMDAGRRELIDSLLAAKAEEEEDTYKEE